MRVTSVRLAWFRGAADPVALEPGERSMVVYGANGAGKSSFIDAVEYAINEGRITHLAFEHSGRHQERAIPNTHTPTDQEAEFWIGFKDGSELHVAIARNGTNRRSGGETVSIHAWDYRRTVLRQDEVAEFIRARKGEKYSALLPLLGLHELEVAAENLRQLARTIEQQGDLARKAGQLDALTARRKQVFGEDDDAAIAAKIAALHKAYCPDSKAAGVAVQCPELDAAITARTTKLTAENQTHLALREIARLDVAKLVAEIRAANAKLAESVEPFVSEKLAVLQAVETYAGQPHEVAELSCPACGRTVQVGDFKAHVAAEHARLERIITVFQERQRAIRTLIDVLKTLQATLAKGELSAWRGERSKGALKTQAEWIATLDPENLREQLREDTLRTIEQNAPALIASANEVSKQAPPDVRDLARAQAAVEAARAVLATAGLAGEIKRIRTVIGFVNAVEAGVRAEIRGRSESVIGEISCDIGQMWKVLHPGEPIDNVRLHLPEDDKAIDVALKFYGKDQDSPRLTLSEGYRNSLGLCIFLAMAKRDAASDRPLFLDDVVVSLDRHHRGMIAELLETEFAGRQVILFTHDRDWFAELRQQLDQKRWGFGVLRPYETPELGIRWSHTTSTFDDARALLKDRPDAAGNDARRIIDTELALIAEKLELRLPYLRGERNDRRSWSEFLDRLIADGQRCLQRKVDQQPARFDDGLKLLEDARRLLVSWGNKSSHSPDIVRPEAAKVIDACEKALAVFRCTSCEKPVWFSNAENAEWVQCECGRLRWRYGKG